MRGLALSVRALDSLRSLAEFRHQDRTATIRHIDDATAGAIH
jgi:hypothetical protein